MLGVIMAGGEGTRLRPLTCNIPKPMVPILGRPVMEYSLELLKNAGINKACVTLQYLPNSIMEHFGDEKCGVGIEYYIEDRPLGTAGSVGNARDFLTETFVVVSGDALTDIDLIKAMEFHKQRGAKVTIVLKRVETPLEYGVVITDPNGRVERFVEKPAWSEVFSDTVNTGIYIIEPEILDLIPQGFFDFSKDLFPLLMKKGIDIYGYIADGYWCDIGDARQYLHAQRDMLDGRVNVRIDGERMGNGIYIQENVTIDESVAIDGPCFIGRNTVIGNGARLAEFNIIGTDCNIDGANLKRSVIWNGTYVGQGTNLRGTIICNGCRIDRDSSIYDGALVGSGSVVGNSVEIRPGVRVWPSKMVESESVLSRDLVWTESAGSTIFSDLGIRGLINVDMTPEYVARIGAAYASIVQGDVAVGYTQEKGGQMLATALASGLMSGGAYVRDAGNCHISVLRYTIRELAMAGGMLVECDGDSACIHLLDNNGADITRAMERKIESVFNRCDGKRCRRDDIKYARDLENTDLFYIRRLARECERVKNKPISIALGGDERSVKLCGEVLQLLECKVYHLDGCCDNAKKISAQLTVIFKSDSVTLYDGNGARITDSQLKALKYHMVTLFVPSQTVFLPVNENEETEKFIKSCGARVERVKTSTQEIMSHIFIADGAETDKQTYFGIMYDPIECVVRIVQMISDNQPLAEIIAKLPTTSAVMREVYCPSRYKGKVIRAIANTECKSKELIDGVKIYTDEGWVLVLPENNRPACRIYSDAFSEEYANELAVRYSDIIRGITQG